jgi:hypothetical protein
MTAPAATRAWIGLIVPSTHLVKPSAGSRARRRSAPPLLAVLVQETDGMVHAAGTLHDLLRA